MSIYILLSFALGFLIAQFLKALSAIIFQKAPLKDLPHHLTKSGGMPSGHSASFVAATTGIGLSCGFDSPLFALAVCTTIIIIYDAINVRYAVGEQGKVLNELVKHHGHAHHHEYKLKIVEGHTLPQVLVGALIGIAIALLLRLFFA